MTLTRDTDVRRLLLSVLVQLGFLKLTCLVLGLFYGYCLRVK